MVRADVQVGTSGGRRRQRDEAEALIQRLWHHNARREAGRGAASADGTKGCRRADRWYRFPVSPALRLHRRRGLQQLSRNRGQHAALYQGRFHGGGDGAGRLHGWDGPGKPLHAGDAGRGLRRRARSVPVGLAALRVCHGLGVHRSHLFAGAVAGGQTAGDLRWGFPRKGKLLRAAEDPGRQDTLIFTNLRRPRGLINLW
eukprot:SAG31_NODE_214_length_20084_cov_2.644684_3_plen_200_part_00